MCIYTYLVNVYDEVFNSLISVGVAISKENKMYAENDFSYRKLYESRMSVTVC